jgi:hypothetical protein
MIDWPPQVLIAIIRLRSSNWHDSQPRGRIALVPPTGGQSSLGTNVYMEDLLLGWCTAVARFYTFYLHILDSPYFLFSSG